MQRKSEKKIFTTSDFSGDWRELIEEMLDHFMVGSDIKTEGEYDGNIRTIRAGLLANRKAGTAEKIAYRNA